MTHRHLLAVLLGAALLGGPSTAARAEAPAAAKRAIEAKDWKQAAALLAAHVAKKPTDRAAALQLAEAVVKSGVHAHNEVVQSALAGLTKKDPKDWAAWAWRGDVTLHSTSSPKNKATIQMVFADAEDQFDRALTGDPDSEAAAVGKARVQFLLGRGDEAAKTIDTYLARETETQARAFFWQGKFRYGAALAAHEAAGSKYPVTGDVQRLFLQAQGAFRASTMSDPEAYTSFLQLAYASQYLQDFDEATAAYSAAAALRPNEDTPLRGLTKLLSYDPKKSLAALEAIVKEHPKHPMAHRYLGAALMKSDPKRALAALEIAAEHGDNAAYEWEQIAKLLTEKGDKDKATKAWRKALEANPNSELAAWHLEAPLRESGMSKARQSVRAAQEVIAEYEKLLKTAPENTGLLNNLAFILREAHAGHKGSAKWLPILKKSTEYYTRAAEATGSFDEARHGALPYADRHSRAQVVSDTGLMYQFYEETRDFKKAEEYYLRALDWSDYGYFDAFNNLSQIYATQERWEELRDLAEGCADNLKNADGSAHPGRGHAAKLLKTAEAKLGE